MNLPLVYKFKNGAGVDMGRWLAPKREENNMKELVPIIEKPQLPENWDYDESVKKVNNLIYKWINITEEMANELWIAREMLRSQGRRTDLEE